jgi:hypothetical protein
MLEKEKDVRAKLKLKNQTAHKFYTELNKGDQELNLGSPGVGMRKSVGRSNSSERSKDLNTGGKLHGLLNMPSDYI